MKMLLRVVSGASSDRDFELQTGTYRIGRGEDASIQVNSRQVSREHAEISVDGNVVRLVDLGSSNGTILNGRKISSEALQNGDQIEVGDVIFEFQSREIKKPEETREAIQFKPSGGEFSRRVFFRSSNRSANPSRRTYMPHAAVSTSAAATRSKKVGSLQTHRFRLRVVLISVLIVSMTSLTLLSGLTYKKSLLSKLSNEAQLRAQTLVRYMAEKNREDIRAKNDLLLDVESVAHEPGVREAYLIDRDLRILAPLVHQHRLMEDPFVAEALAQRSDQKILPSPIRPDGTRIFVHPIRGFNEKSGTYETLGVAKLVFSSRDAAGSLTGFYLVWALLFLLSISLATLLGWLGARTIERPLGSLSERLHVWRSQTTSMEPLSDAAPFPEFDPLFDAVAKITEERPR